VAEFKVPELGENVAGGDVTRILVNVGDTIKRDQTVIELETDKATIEVPSSVAGVVKSVAVKQGDKIKVGAVILTVDDAGSGNGAGAAAEPGRSEGTETGRSERTETGPSERTGPTATAKQADEEPGSGDRVGPVLSDRPDSKPEPQKVLAMPSRQASGAPEPSAALPGLAAPKAERAEERRPETGRAEGSPAAPASPAVRRLAREVGVDVNQVQGSGPAGRISLDDVKEHARRILSSVGTAGAAAGMASRATRQLPDFAKWGDVERQPWTNIRRATAEHLSYAWTAIPHVTQFDKADVTALEDLRKKYKEPIAKAGGNLTVTAMLVRILATAVRKFPQFNASIDVERGEIVYKKFVNIGVAVDTDRGLLVPVIRHADTKNIQQIAVELNQLAGKAREKKLTLEEMSGGGMSISNLGGIGGTYFTPIVNWPEVAILGVSRGATEPVWRNDAFEPRLMLPLSLSYDHRVIDGADAMRFLRWVAEAIEQPFLLSLIG
jgi:pyruvate dehydrogenase E2 component (dihydrolipoamide acetyltransferase)